MSALGHESVDSWQIFWVIRILSIIIDKTVNFNWHIAGSPSVIELICYNYIVKVLWNKYLPSEKQIKF